jgi:CRP/FNR family transcriptional regulator, cyclic AMP receptor protein
MRMGRQVIAKGFPVGDNHTRAWPPASFLAALTDEQRRDLLSRGSERHFERGATLMNQGESGDVVAVLLEGLVKVWAVSPEGHESLLGLRGNGDLLGEMAFTTRSPRTARVVASTRIRARVFADHEFTAYLDRWPGAAVQMAAAIVHKLRAANQRRAEFLACDSKQRIAIIISEALSVSVRHVE